MPAFTRDPCTHDASYHLNSAKRRNECCTVLCGGMPTLCASIDMSVENPIKVSLGIRTPSSYLYRKIIAIFQPRKADLQFCVRIRWVSWFWSTSLSPGQRGRNFKILAIGATFVVDRNKPIDRPISNPRSHITHMHAQNWSCGTFLRCHARQHWHLQGLFWTMQFASHGPRSLRVEDFPWSFRIVIAGIGSAGRLNSLNSWLATLLRFLSTISVKDDLSLEPWTKKKWWFAVFHDNLWIIQELLGL